MWRLGSQPCRQVGSCRPVGCTRRCGKTCDTTGNQSRSCPAEDSSGSASDGAGLASGSSEHYECMCALLFPTKCGREVVLVPWCALVQSMHRHARHGCGGGCCHRTQELHCSEAELSAEQPRATQDSATATPADASAPKTAQSKPTPQQMQTVLAKLQARRRQGSLDKARAIAKASGTAPSTPSLHPPNQIQAGDSGMLRTLRGGETKK